MAASAAASESLLAQARCGVLVDAWNATRLSVRQHPALALDVHIVGALRAIIGVAQTVIPQNRRAGQSASSWVPTSVAVSSSDDPMPLGVSQPLRSLVFRQITANAAEMMTCLEAIPAERRLVWLVCHLSALHGVFSTPCSVCGRHLHAPATEPTSLIPPIVRCTALRPYLPSCFDERFGGEPPERGWIQKAQMGTPTEVGMACGGAAQDVQDTVQDTLQATVQDTVDPPLATATGSASQIRSEIRSEIGMPIGSLIPHRLGAAGFQVTKVSANVTVVLPAVSSRDTAS